MDVVNWVLTNWFQLIVIGLLFKTYTEVQLIKQRGIFSVWDMIFYDRKDSLSMYEIDIIRRHFGLGPGNKKEEE